MYKNILKKIKNNKIKIAIIGLGYVGLPLIERFIKKKIDVLGIETNPEKIKLLRKGISYIPNVQNKHLSYFVRNPEKITDDYTVTKNVDAIIICLPTPLKDYKTPNMHILINCIKKLKNYIGNNQILIIESTVYPGATEELFSELTRKKKFVLGKNFYLIFSPERENPGDKFFSYSKTPKVIGGSTENCKKIGYFIYKKIVNKIHLTKSIKIAEMSKLLENSYREVNIGLVNEMKLISERMKINIWDVIEASKTKNFGFSTFYPGPGTGGHCIPIDPMYLVWASKKKNYLPKLIWSSSRLNSSMPKIIFNKLIKLLKRNKINSKKILIVGAAYKKNIDDLRHSPAIEFISYLKELKFNVSYHDPYIKKINLVEKKIFLKSMKLNHENLKDIKIVLIVTDHDQVDYKKILKYGKLIIDTRGVYKNYPIKKIEKVKFL